MTLSTITCDPLSFMLEGLKSPGDPHRTALLACGASSFVTFVVSTLSGNYSQVDKLWSVLPAIYAWIAVCDERTLLMASLATIWGARLTWNFHRRGGYTWPPWRGDEDYRWRHIRDGEFVPILRNPVAWHIFNLGFISVYQNLLLWLIAAPSFVAGTLASRPECGDALAPLSLFGLDGVAAVLFLLLVVIESIADNQQWQFQTEKQHRLRKARDGDGPTGEYADGFCQSGLFAILRKPNYAAEQSIWTVFYFFSVAAMGGSGGGGGLSKVWNWSAIGPVLLVQLFQASGWFTEKLSMKRYPKYAEYKKRVPLYVPSPTACIRYLVGRESGRPEKED